MILLCWTDRGSIYDLFKYVLFTENDNYAKEILSSLLPASPNESF